MSGLPHRLASGIHSDYLPSEPPKGTRAERAPAPSGGQRPPYSEKQSTGRGPDEFVWPPWDFADSRISSTLRYASSVVISGVVALDLIFFL